MKEDPDFIDNIGSNTLANALKHFIKTKEDKVKIKNIKIATAYFSPAGFFKIASIFKGVPEVKILLGTDPLDEQEKWKKKLGESEDKFIAKKFRDNLKKQEDNLRQERDNVPFSRDSYNQLKIFVKLLKEGKIEVKRYEINFLHAKAYIFNHDHSISENCLDALIAGSSNLTSSGLASNLELNLAKFDKNTLIKANQWFDNIWEQSTFFDLASFFEEIFEPKTPYEIFLRVLWELYGDEINEDFKSDGGLPLTTFQQHGVARALRLIKETGGAIIADEVGLGKTFIAAEILKEYMRKRQRALLICPAALRDSSWDKFTNDYSLYIETLSFEEIAQDKQLYHPIHRPNSDSENLKRKIDEYQLIIIDEAHNYRNPDSQFRAGALRKLLYGPRKDILMLTATPVNNSLWDLYNLTLFFLKQDSLLADKGILSIRRRFEDAMRTDPTNLSPDTLYPIVDATTVKRTRRFIKKYYGNDHIEYNGKLQPIVFPEPKAITVRYDLESLMPGLFDLIEKYLDPDNPECISFARYRTDDFLKNKNENEEANTSMTVTGLLLSGLLKRFESSTGAFKLSIKRLIEQHKNFLKAVEQGFIVGTEFLRDSLGTDDEDFEELLKINLMKSDQKLYEIDKLKNYVNDDLQKLLKIHSLLEKITIHNDPKLKILVQELSSIASEAKSTSVSEQDEINKRKIIIFSFFADTVLWIKNYLNEVVKNNRELECYLDRIETITGKKGPQSLDKSTAAARFAPRTAGIEGSNDTIDILISTDVLAEGVNLQQARHIINYDLPWNPMRLVQRHGRIDRIGSEHSRVFMRTIFPVDRLDALLGLEEKIARKIAMAAASVGVYSPIAQANSIDRNFTETREEIQKLLEEDPSLYERGGTKNGVQSGEEYRQTLRKEIKNRGDEIKQMPWKVGSGILKGKEQGMFFCAKVGERTYLRFVHTSKKWEVKERTIENSENAEPIIDFEIGRCLRLIECSPDSETVMNKITEDSAYDLWLIAKDHIYKSWTFETDPLNLQPQVRPLNRNIAEFIRTNIPKNIPQKEIEKALNILESPWSRRDEKELKIWFTEELDGIHKAEFLTKKIISSGLEGFIPPKRLNPIDKSEIKLIAWMAINSI